MTKSALFYDDRNGHPSSHISMLYLNISSMCESLTKALRRNTQEGGEYSTNCLYAYCQRNNSTRLISYLLAPAQAANVMLVRSQFSQRTPRNCKRRNHKPTVLSKHCFPIYTDITESPSVKACQKTDKTCFVVKKYTISLPSTS